MTRYSIEPKDSIFVKCYRYLSFAKNMSKNVGKNLRGKYRPGMLAALQKFLDHTHAKQSATDALKIALKRVVQETAEPIGVDW